MWACLCLPFGAALPAPAAFSLKYITEVFFFLHFKKSLLLFENRADLESIHLGNDCHCRHTPPGLYGCVCLNVFEEFSIK